MKRFTVLNSILLCITSFSLGGTFWLWKGEFVAAINPPPTLPPAISFQEIKKTLESAPPVGKRSTSSAFWLVSASTASSTVDSVLPEVSFSASEKLETPIEIPKQIPREINLAVPFTSQAPEKNWAQPWQDACEEAAALMLDAYYKEYKLNVLFAKDEILKMVKWEEETKGWGRSIEIETIQEIFGEYLRYNSLKLENLKTLKQVQIIENPTIEQIKNYVGNGTPVYVVADGKVLPNPHFRNGGPEYHALIIRGYTETEFITNDPGTQFGENFKYQYDDLMKSIRDWNGGDVKSGRRVILVVE